MLSILYSPANLHPPHTHKARHAPPHVRPGTSPTASRRHLDLDRADNPGNLAVHPPARRAPCHRRLRPRHKAPAPPPRTPPT